MKGRIVNRIFALTLCVAMIMGCVYTGGIVFAETDISYENMTRYDWYKNGEEASAGVILTVEELLAHVDCDSAAAEVVVTNADGLSEGANPYAQVKEDGSVLYRNDGRVGADVFYFCVLDGNRTYGPVAVDVYVYGINDATFVLDYSLPALITEADLLNGDVLTLADAPADGFTVTVEDLEPNMPDVNKQGAYGTFSATEEGLLYTVDSIMNGVDTVEVAVRIARADLPFVENVTGVTMIKTVTVAPANVVYYEDDCPGIVYKNTDPAAEDGNIWAIYEGDKSFFQSVDGSMNYGYDPVYDSYNAEDELIFVGVEMDGLDESLVDREFLDDAAADVNEVLYWDRSEPFSIYGDASNDTMHVMSVKRAEAAEIFSFDFVGTGFEILSRTTMDPYAVFTVKVEKQNEDGSYSIARVVPVITACTNGDLTQVPVVACKDMDYGSYRVTVTTSNALGVGRMVYLDGIRVYQPLTAEMSARYYKADEAAVRFYEVQNSIRDGNIVYGQVMNSSDTGDSASRWQFGSTMIENFTTDESMIGMDFILTNTEPAYEPGEYLDFGPNNEIYLSNPLDASLSYIAFYVVKDESYVGERSIQIGAHLKYTGNNFGYDMTSVEMIYGGSASDFTAGSKQVHQVVSGTELYYEIDDSCLVFKSPNGYEQALVIIGTRDKNENVLALTNIKMNGYKLADTVAAELFAVQDMCDVNACILMGETAALYKAIVAENVNKE